MNLSTSTRLAIPIVAAAYSDKFGVKISVSGSQAYATRDQINLPVITNFDKELLWGYLAHEAGHIRFTNFNVCEGLNGLRHTLWNIVEDIWIENCMIREYLGTAATMDAILDYNIKLGHLKGSSQEDDPRTIFLSYILISGRYLYRRQCSLAPLYQETKGVIINRIGQRIVDELDRILSKVKDATSTQDCVAIADDILRFLNEQQQAGAASDDSCDAEAQGSSQHGSDDSGDAEDQGSSQQGSDDSGDAEAQGSSQHGSDDSGDAEDQDSSQHGSDDSGKGFLDSVLSDTDGQLESFDLTDAVREALNNSGSSATGDIDELPPYLPALRPDYWTTDRGPQLLANVRSESHAIRTRLHGLIQANTLVRDRLHRSGKQVAPNKLARLATGNTKVFKHKAEKHLPNADIHLIVDLSGSMAKNVENKQCSQLAVEAAVALADALQTVKGLSVTMTAFGPERDHPISIIGEGEKVRQSASRFITVPHGNTPMSYALMHAGVSVLSRKNKRKIIFAMTDGEPDNITQTMKTISLLENEGVELHGIGINHQTSHLFKRSVVISDLSELKTELFKVAHDALINN